MDINNSIKNFGEVAQGFSKNPLGIIALFLVFVYAFASIVAGFGHSFSPHERIPLIYFLVFFPVLVLGVFAWLVSRHAIRLYSPSDYRDEQHFIDLMRQSNEVNAQLTQISNIDISTNGDLSEEEILLSLKVMFYSSMANLHAQAHYILTRNDGIKEFIDKTYREFMDMKDVLEPVYKIKPANHPMHDRYKVIRDSGLKAVKLSTQL